MYTTPMPNQAITDELLEVLAKAAAEGKTHAAMTLGSLGGKARAWNLSKDELSAIALKGARAWWGRAWAKSSESDRSGDLDSVKPQPGWVRLSTLLPKLRPRT